MEERQEVIDCIRTFNRFYTVLLGFLNQNYLGTGYSVTETRILFEIHQQEGISAKQLCTLLRLDKSYMSRLIRSLEHQGILCRETDPTDRRANCIYLTVQGRTEVAGLIRTTNQEIEHLIGTFDMEVCGQICEAMDLIREKFSMVSREEREHG